MLPISEASFMAQVKALAYIHGWVVHHSQPSMTRTGRYMTMGSVGFPDLVMAHRDKGLIFAELKTEKELWHKIIGVVHWNAMWSITFGGLQILTLLPKGWPHAEPRSTVSNATRGTNQR